MSYYNSDDPCGCYCGSDSIGQSHYHESGITADEYKQFLFDSLTDGLKCIPPDFFDNICNFWDLYRTLACGSNDIRYLHTRIQTLVMIVACNAYDVTTRTSVAESNTRSEMESKSDSLTQGQMTSHNSAYSESVFESGYADFANSRLRAESQRSAESSARDISETRSSDTGRGEGHSLTTGARDASSDRISRDQSSSSGTSASSGARWGTDYSFSHSAKDSNAGFAIVGSMAREATRGSNYRIMNAETVNHATTGKFGQSSKFLEARSWSQSWSERTSHSWFQALMDSYTRARSNAEAFDYSSSTSDAEAHSAGKGQSAAETEQRATSSSQRTSETDSLSTSRTDGAGNSYSIAEYRASSQKIDHYLKLLSDARQALEHALRLRATGIGIAIGKMSMGNRYGYCNVGAIERRLYQPGGLYGIQCCPSQPKGVQTYAN